jgi:hypothetical protein
MSDRKNQSRALYSDPNTTYVMRLEITVQDTVGMAKSDATEDLLHKGLDHGLGQTDTLVDVIAGLILIHEGLEVVCHKFKYQIQATGLGLNYIQ